MTKRLDYSQTAPNGAKALGGVYGYVMQSGLPAELVELVYLRVGSTRALRRSHPGRTWRARCAVRRPRTANTRSALVNTMRIGRTGTPPT